MMPLKFRITFLIHPIIDIKIEVLPVEDWPRFRQKIGQEALLARCWS
jgi:hypothetical protein